MPRLLAAALVLTGALALAAPASASRTSDALRRELGPGVKVAAHGETGQVRFVGAAARPIETGAATAREAARVFVAQHGDAFGGGELEVTSSRGSSIRFQQRLDGIPVLGGELVVNVDAGHDVVSATGELLPGSAARIPRVTAAAARQEAIAATAKDRGVSAVRLTATNPELWIYDARLLGGPGPQHPTLVWRLDVEGDSGLAIDDLVLIDAASGSVALRIEQIAHADPNRSVCDAGNADADSPCTSPDREEGDDVPTGIAEVDNAYDFLGDVHDFYDDRFGRDSLDGAGMPLVATVRYCEGGCPYDNAFWDGEQMYFGQTWANADDAVGHEATHGVTEFSAGLFYYYQSGAINESMSDVFGEFIDLTNGDADPRWQIFEDIDGGPLRDMQDPTLAADTPDRMTSPAYWPFETDQGGVHFNSGVGNKAAYLIADGDDFNGRSVAGIGVEKAARVYYRALTTKLTSASDYADLATALGQSCDELVGTAGITAANCTEVRDAVDAVEMNTDPPLAPAPEAPAAVCPGTEVRTDLFRDDMEDSDNWLATDLGRWGFFDGYATSGRRVLFGADSASLSDTNAFMANAVALPEGATPFLRFEHAFGFDDTGDTAFDGGVLEFTTEAGPSATWQDIESLSAGTDMDVGYNGAITTSSNNPIEGRAAFVQESHGYRSTRAKLAPLAGESVRFRWRIATNSSSGGKGWYVDDVHIYSCAPPPAPPDGDGDGVPDASDACPGVAASTLSGCPTPVTDPPGPVGPPGPITQPKPNPTGTLASARVGSCKVAGRGRKARVRCTLRSAGAVTRASVTVKKGRKTVAKKTVRPSAAGVLSFKPSRALRRGSYKVTLVLRDARGGKRSITKTLRVR